MPADVLVPQVSLDELYDQRVAAWLRQAGRAIHLETPVAIDYRRGRSSPPDCDLPTAAERAFDFVIRRRALATRGQAAAASAY